MAIQIFRKLIFCFFAIGALWFLCSFLSNKSIKNNSIATTHLQNTTSVINTSNEKPEKIERIIQEQHPLHNRTPKIDSPLTAIESLARPSVAQIEPQNEDLKQKILIEEITAEINTSQSIWQRLREQIYDEMQLDEQVRYKLLLTRENNYKVLEEITNNLQNASDEEKSNLVNAYIHNRKWFSFYVQQTLGPMRFDYLKKAHAKLNVALEAQNPHGTQVSEDW